MLQALSKQDQTLWAMHKAMLRFSAHIAPYGGRCCYHPIAINGSDILLTFRDGRSLRVRCLVPADLLLSLLLVAVPAHCLMCEVSACQRAPEAGSCTSALSDDACHLMHSSWQVADGMASPCLSCADRYPFHQLGSCTVMMFLQSCLGIGAAASIECWHLPLSQMPCRCHSLAVNAP